MKLTLEKHWTTGEIVLRRFIAASLRDTIKPSKSKITLNNRSQALRDLLEEETTMGDDWNGVKDAITSKFQEVPGRNKHHNKQWISVETLEKIQGTKRKKTVINSSQTRTEKVKAQTEYIGANKQVKKSVRVDHQKYVNDLATMLEKAAREGNMRRLYDTTKKLV
ncbi:unnamed protein product [Schistosoma mattheei]|uniref:Uncharacterized protein n=1 Tax=Schistosoma mattheei TaxID=31246 RepID=A0A183PR99_9TREM|nr:unnamed protein product [Schistosoma mattheei]